MKDISYDYIYFIIALLFSSNFKTEIHQNKSKLYIFKSLCIQDFPFLLFSIFLKIMSPKYSVLEFKRFFRSFLWIKHASSILLWMGFLNLHWIFMLNCAESISFLLSSIACLNITLFSEFFSNCFACSLPLMNPFLHVSPS